MKRSLLIVLALIPLVSTSTLAQNSPNRHKWPVYPCRPTLLVGLQDDSPRNVSIPSPDNRKVFRVRIGPDNKPVITITSNGKPVQHSVSYEHQPSLMWSPDSNAFLIGFTDAGSYDGWQLKLFVFEGNNLKEYDDVGRAASLETARRFPPCVTGSKLKLASCDIAGFASTLNVSALKWLGPEALAIQVQVPCSTSYGPNACKYQVFDVAVPSGRILHSYSAKEARSHYSECFNSHAKTR